MCVCVWVGDTTLMFYGGMCFLTTLLRYVLCEGVCLFVYIAVGCESVMCEDVTLSLLALRVCVV